MRKDVIISAFLSMALTTGFATTLATEGSGEPIGLVVGQEEHTTAPAEPQAQEVPKPQGEKKGESGKQEDAKPQTTPPNRAGQPTRRNSAPTQPQPDINLKEKFNNGGVGDNGANEGNEPETNVTTATTTDDNNAGGQQPASYQSVTNTDNQNYDNTQYYGEEEDSTNSLLWVVVGLIVIGGLVYWFFGRRQKPYEFSTNDKSGRNRSAHSRDRRTSQPSGATPRDNAANDFRMARLEERVQALENTISSLNSTINTLSSRLNNDWQNIQSGNYLNPSNPVQPVPPPNAAQTIYCSQVHSNMFVQSGHSEQGTPNTICVITAKGDSGEYELYNDPSAQQRMIATFMSAIAPVAEVRSKTQIATRIDTVKKGSVRKQGDDWVILEKAVVELK